MSLEELIVIIVRLSGSLPVIYFPFFGSLFAILVDLSDLFIIGNLDLGGVRNYQRLDKLLDLSYMITFLMNYICKFIWIFYIQDDNIYLNII